MAPNINQQQFGRLEGMLTETVLRLDRFELRETQIEQHLVDLIQEIRAKSAGAALIGALCGAFAGAVSGAITAVFVVNWLSTVIERAVVQ